MARIPLVSAVFAALVVALAMHGGIGPTAAAITVSGCGPGSGPDLAHITLTQAQSQQSLRCADLEGSTLDDLQLTQADLQGANLRGASLRHTHLGQADLSFSDLTGANLTGADLEQATLKGAALQAIHAAGASFAQDDLHGLSLRNADLANADLEQANLRGADLRDADLDGAALTQTDLRGSDLRGARIGGADLTEAETDCATRMNGDTRGAFPLEVLVAGAVLLVAVIALRPRLAGRDPGKAAAVIIVAILGIAVAAEVAAEWGWNPTEDDLFFLPLATPIVFLGIFVGRTIRRSETAAIAALSSVLALIGLAVLLRAGLALIAGPDAFGILPLAQSCSTASCGFGLLNGWLAVGVGVMLMVTARLVSGTRPSITSQTRFGSSESSVAQSPPATSSHGASTSRTESSQSL